MITIYHKPTCSTSRKVLQMIRDAGHEPEIVDYAREGWTRAQLLGLFAAADVTPRQAMRVKGTDAAERGLLDAGDEDILAAMVENPLLVERPIVCGPGGVRLCRPAELVAETFAR
ncbi:MULTISPECIES: arsenate reductase family protein [Paracoccus]|jgi:arsenate reductase|uniref:Arsenate reductase n=1 Tax=Paracoccus denitrificans (strain Pd 1222) TaxID=318586 RepID=A1B4B9_PARDP|nr:MULTISPECIES: arsenate reductase family protein [Paracoccus]ABL70363.1 arsenate reductase [Paracoccus denitrificans PD1222]MBB4627274.1 arsenate reductase [Paracoccus denitrificans]MCU7427953.1 arsenate reductase family protein [Paracoccus denitrificans]MDK8875504.1 arsenate reductase family protein [Paracoccus sp. SSJ]QAR25710.1 arsenate reductase family protein [Paracoccus denitrificans]